MPVDVGGHLDIGVSHPFLHIFEGEPGVDEQAGAAVTKLMQAVWGIPWAFSKAGNFLVM